MKIQTQQGTRQGERTGIAIRAAVGEDLEAVVALGSLVFRATYLPIAGADYVEMGLAKWWSPGAVIETIRSGHMVVAELEGQLVGVAQWGRQDGRPVIWRVYVLPDLQRSGVGTALVRTLCEELTGLGREDVYISYTFGNERTRRWLDRLGFVEQWRDEGNDLVPTQVWTRKILTPSAAAAASDPDDRRTP